MPKFKFVGAEPVDVPSLGLVDVQPGDVIDGPDGLAGQAQWEPVPARRRAAKKATKRAPAKRAAAPPTPPAIDPPDGSGSNDEKG